MRAGQLMKKPSSIASDALVSEVIMEMSKKRIREIFVEDKGKLVGMIDFYSIVDAGIGKNTKIGSLTFMPPVLSKDEPVEDIVKKILATGLEALPVVEGELLVGRVSTYEILENTKPSGTVSEVMVEAVAIQSDDAIAKARTIMRINNINRLPVLDARGDIVGMITTSDIVKRVFSPHAKDLSNELIAEKVDHLKQPVHSIMSSPVITINPGQGLEEAVKIMLEYDLRTLPVVAGRKLVGIISRKDVLRHTLHTFGGVKILFSGLDKMDDVDVPALRDFTKSVVKRVAYEQKFNQVEISLKMVRASAYEARVEAGEKSAKAEDSSLLEAVKKALYQLKKV